MCISPIFLSFSAHFSAFIHNIAWFSERTTPLIPYFFSAVVVKTVVKQALTHKTGNAARGKVLEPQGKIAGRAN